MIPSNLIAVWDWRLKPVPDARVADIEKKLGLAHTIQAHAIKADDALTFIERVIGAELGMGELVHPALLAVHAIEARAVQDIESLKAIQRETRGW